MAVKSDIIDKDALEKSLKEVTSSIEKAFSSSLANVTKGITAALFLIARPSVVTVNTIQAEKRVSKFAREVEHLNFIIEKKKALGVDAKEGEKSLKILNESVRVLEEKKKYSEMTLIDTQKEINLLKEKKKVFESINIKIAGIKTANKELEGLNADLEKLKNEITITINNNFPESEEEFQEITDYLNKLEEKKTNMELEIKIKTDEIEKSNKEVETLKTELGKLGVDTTKILIGVDDDKVKSELAIVNKELKNAEKERTIKLRAVGFEKVISGFEQFDKAFRAFGGMASTTFALADQLMQQSIDNLGEQHEAEQALLDEKYEAEVDKLSENLETKQGMLDELDERDAERQALMDEIETAKSEEERTRLEEKLKGYEGDAEKRILLNDEIATAEDTLLSDKDAAETKYNEDKVNKERIYLTKKAEMERKQAITAKTMKVMEAVIGTASAILAATINGLSAPFPLSLVMVPLLVGMAAVTGAVQIAAIAATPMPEVPSFSSGGIVSGSNDHLYPNIPKSKNRDDRTLAWLSEGEMVLTRNQTEMYDNIIARDTFNSVNNNNVNHITNDIKIYTDNKTNTKLLAKQIVLEISRGYS